MDKFTDSFIDSLRESFVDDLRTLVDIKSVRSDPVAGNPFGDGCAEAVTKAEEILLKHGFSSVNYANFALESDLGNNPCLMLLAHLDVVPEGDGWTKQPYNMSVEGNLCYGRGTTDDKGAALACIYAMKAVLSVYGVPEKGVRLVLGAGEETGSEDMDYYFSKRPVLDYTLSPDADYPVINLEKGRFAPVFHKDIDCDSFILSINGGDTANIVPGKAYACVTGFTKTQLDETFADVSAFTGAKFTYTLDGGICRITCIGTSAHAASPVNGNNANTALIEALVRLPFVKTDKLVKSLSGLAKYFPHGDTSGKAAGVDMEDEQSGSLTLNFGILSFDGKRLTAGLDLRCPLCAGDDNVKNVITEKIHRLGFEFEGHPEMRPVHYVPPDSELVKTSLEVYEEYTGEKGECLAIGGGTYVHDIEGGIAFGIEFPGRDYHIHGADEFADIDELLLTSKMYASIIKRLAY